MAGINHGIFGKDKASCPSPLCSKKPEAKGQLRQRAVVAYRLDTKFPPSLLDLGQHALLGSDLEQTGMELPLLEHLGLLLGA